MWYKRPITTLLVINIDNISFSSVDIFTFAFLKALSASIEMEVFVHREALFLNIVGEITRMAKVIKEIRSDLNMFLAGGLFRGEGQGRRWEGHYLTFYLPFFVCGAV